MKMKHCPYCGTKLKSINRANIYVLYCKKCKNFYPPNIYIVVNSKEFVKFLKNEAKDKKKKLKLMRDDFKSRNK